jgi:FMN phosphatase YigB (HAD superfamily)
LESFGVARYLSPIVLSEEAGVEKPDPKIFSHSLQSINYSIRSTTASSIVPEECLHIGDELVWCEFSCSGWVDNKLTETYLSDYHGALSSSFKALLLRRPGELGEGENKEAGENLSGVNVVQDLWGVVTTVKALNLP